MTEKNLRALRRRVDDLKTGHGRRYPADLRTSVVSALAPARAEGWTWERLGAALTINVDTLRCWWRDAERSGEPGLVPVRVAHDAAESGASISLVTPAGYRVEGLSVAGAAQLLRALS